MPNMKVAILLTIEHVHIDCGLSRNTTKEIATENAKPISEK